MKQPGGERTADRARDGRGASEPPVRGHELLGVVDEPGDEGIAGDRVGLCQHEHREGFGEEQQVAEIACEEEA